MAPTRIVAVDPGAMHPQGGTGPRHPHIGRQNIDRAHQDAPCGFSYVSSPSSEKTFLDIHDEVCLKELATKSLVVACGLCHLVCLGHQ